MKGLFQESTLLRTKQFSNAARCGACGLYKKCRSPKLAPQGGGASGLLIVLPPISHSADSSGKFLNCEIGQKVKRLLKQNGLSPSADVLVSAATICHTNTPSPQQIDFCSFKLRETINSRKPTRVIAIGAEATRNIIQFTWNRESGDSTRFFGARIPSQVLNSWVCPIMAPTEDDRDCSELLFERQFQSAMELTQAPWETAPDYKSEVRLLSAKEAVKFIQMVRKKRGIIAWDIETNSLKPEHPQSAILTGSICWNGKHTVAFPWHQNVPEAMQDILADKRIGKIASNLQFEHRWSKWKLGLSVQGWVWDTMQAAHVLDNRRGTTSIKFQSLIHLGFPSYNDKIEEYFTPEDEKESDPHALNRAIQEIPIEDLLLYNGLDSLLEYKVAKIQAEIMGHKIRKYL